MGSRRETLFKSMWGESVTLPGQAHKSNKSRKPKKAKAGKVKHEQKQR